MIIMEYPLITAVLMLMASSYIILESISYASQTDPQTGRLCYSARYLTCAVAGLFYFKDSIGIFLYEVTFGHLPYYLQWIKVKGVEPITIKDCIALFAITLSCWPRMVFRIFPHQFRKTEATTR